MICTPRMKWLSLLVAITLLALILISEVEGKKERRGEEKSEEDDQSGSSIGRPNGWNVQWSQRKWFIEQPGASTGNSDGDDNDDDDNDEVDDDNYRVASNNDSDDEDDDDDDDDEEVDDDIYRVDSNNDSDDEDDDDDDDDDDEDGSVENNKSVNDLYKSHRRFKRHKGKSKEKHGHKSKKPKSKEKHKSKEKRESKEKHKSKEKSKEHKHKHHKHHKHDHSKKSKEKHHSKEHKHGHKHSKEKGSREDSDEKISTDWCYDWCVKFAKYNYHKIFTWNNTVFRWRENDGDRIDAYCKDWIYSHGHLCNVSRQNATVTRTIPVAGTTTPAIKPGRVCRTSLDCEEDECCLLSGNLTKCTKLSGYEETCSLDSEMIVAKGLIAYTHACPCYVGLKCQAHWDAITLIRLNMSVLIGAKRLYQPKLRSCKPDERMNTTTAPTTTPGRTVPGRRTVPNRFTRGQTATTTAARRTLPSRSTIPSRVTVPARTTRRNVQATSTTTQATTTQVMTIIEAYLNESTSVNFTSSAWLECSTHLDCGFLECCVRQDEDDDVGICTEFSNESQECVTLAEFEQHNRLPACPCQSFLQCKHYDNEGSFCT